jgi:hypothetical protein
MFARLLIGDLFVHGIGGAKYDELGDTILHHFFELPPPGFLTATMTLWLGLPEPDVDPDGLPALERHLRDLRHQPDRFADPDDPSAAPWIARKREALAAPTATRRARKARCLAIREANAALAPAVAPHVEAARARLDEARARLRSRRWARYREYPAVLQPADRLAAALARATGWTPPQKPAARPYSPEAGAIQ